MNQAASFRQRRTAAAAWIDYCDRLKTAADLLVRDDLPVSELDLAEGLRYLAHLSFAAIQRFVDGADPARPLLYLLCDERIKSGGDNPDNRYYVSAVDAAYEYELHGRFDDCVYYSIVALDRKDMTSGLTAEQRAQRASSARLDSATLKADADGSVRVTIGQPARDGNHLVIDEHTNMVIVRCTFEQPGAREADLSVRRIDDKGSGPQITFETLNTQLRAAADHVHDTSRFFANWAAGFQQHLNQLPLGDQAYIRSTGGDPNILYYLSAWALRGDEALVVHLPRIPRCTTWNFQLCNIWMESLDYTSARIHLNAATAQPDADGGVTMVVCARDPGHANWLDTTGHLAGTMCLRFTGAEFAPLVQTSIVSIDAARRLAGRPE
jgi:hypothetical protein